MPAEWETGRTLLEAAIMEHDEKEGIREWEAVISSTA